MNDGAVEPLEQPAFRRELTPTWLSTAALLARQPPLDPDRPLRIADVAGGSGVQAAVAAACHPGAEVWAVRLTPADAEHAQRLAADAGLDNITAVEWLPSHGAPGLPAGLDVVVLDDVISTVDEDRRAELVEVITRRVRAGGMVALSYRTLVGWAGIVPLRRLALLVAGGRDRPAAERVDAVVRSLRRLRDGGASYIRERSTVAEAVDDLLNGSSSAVERLLLTDRLEPQSLRAVVDWLRPTGATFVGSLRVGDELPATDEPLGELLADTPDRLLREALREIAARPAYRLDLFRRGSTPLGGADRRDRLAQLALHPVDASIDMLAGRSGDIDEKAVDRLRRGPATVDELLPTGWVGEDADVLVRQLLDRGLAHPTSAGWATHDTIGRCRALNDVLTGRGSPELAGIQVIAAIGSAVRTRGVEDGPTDE